VITVEEAKQIVTSEIPKGPKITLPLQEASGRILAEDVFSLLDSPLFNASAMDGFAIHHEETYRASRAFPSYFKITGLVAAGDVPSKPLGKNEAIKVMTGAMIPQGATAVIPQEEVLPSTTTLEGRQDRSATILITREVKEGEHLRRKGEEIKQGGLALSKNTHLTSGAIGFLASLGVLNVPVYAPPRIFILPTGSELVRDISEVTPGKIMESNSFCLSSAMSEMKIEPKISSPVPDVNKVLFAIIEQAIKNYDLLLITGGVSVGTFDLVKEILEKLNVKTLFWQVAQKPGKPLYFGKCGSTLVFGLPGNPASSLVCFYEYVRPAILKWLGYQDCFLSQDRARLVNSFSKKEGRTHFIRARTEKKNGNFWVHVPEGQESHRMQSFAEANSFLVVPQEITELKEGEEVTIHWLP